MRFSNINLFRYIFFLMILAEFMISGCATATLKIQSPAEINTDKIVNVAVGSFEIGGMSLKYKSERNGVWQTHLVKMNEDEKKSISRSIRARVVNLLTETYFFKVVFSDEFEKLENDASLQELISVRGYKTENVDAVLNGIVWLEIDRTDGCLLYTSDAADE